MTCVNGQLDKYREREKFKRDRGMYKLVKTKINHQIADEETEKQIRLPGVRTKETYIFR